MKTVYSKAKCFFCDEVFNIKHMYDEKEEKIRPFLKKQEFSSKHGVKRGLWWVCNKCIGEGKAA